MTRRTLAHLNFGPPSLSRIYCKKCKAETIHKNFGICIHCKTRVRCKDLEFGKGQWQTAAEKKKKQQREAMKKLRLSRDETGRFT